MTSGPAELLTPRTKPASSPQSRATGNVASQIRKTKRRRPKTINSAAAETLRIIAADPKHLGAGIGLIAVLHSSPPQSEQLSPALLLKVYPEAGGIG